MKDSSSSKLLTPAAGQQRRKPNIIKVVKETPRKYHGAYCPLNLEEQKSNFLRYGIAPTFVLKGGSQAIQQMSEAKREVARISTRLLGEAVRILEAWRQRYPSSDEFLEHTYGPPVTYKEGSAIVSEYLHDNKLDGRINIVWSCDLDCSGRMMWHGPNTRLNRPEARKHTLLIKNSPENMFQRRQGIVCLANHEIGTHYLRSANEGLQPWYSDRKKFGLRPTSCYESMVTEEGLATLHTVLQARSKFLYQAALLYYTASMGAELTFHELFDHLEKYVQSADQRWKLTMRVKRAFVDQNGLGGYGKDQCYFEGALSILQNLDTVDFPLLYSGQVCLDDLDRVKRLARLDCIRLPHFMEDPARYRRLLRQIGIVNGIIKARPRTSKVKVVAPRPNPLPPLCTPSQQAVRKKDEAAGSASLKKRSADGRGSAATPSLGHGNEEDITTYSRTFFRDQSHSVAIVEPLDTRVGADILVTVPFADVKFYDRALSPSTAGVKTPGLSSELTSSPNKKFNLGEVIKKLSNNEKALIYSVATRRSASMATLYEGGRLSSLQRDSGAGKEDSEEEEEIGVAFHKPSTSADELKMELEKLTRRPKLPHARLAVFDDEADDRYF